MRWFIYIFLKERPLQDCLNTLIFLCNPTEKSIAHITVGGPYERLETAKTRAAEKFHDKRIAFLGAGNFFSNDQNTVFLRCEFEFYKHVWDKDGFRIPHLTVYDGPSVRFAQQLYETLSGLRVYFTASVGAIELVASVRGQKDFKLLMSANEDVAKRVLGSSFTLNDAFCMSDSERLFAAGAIASMLKNEAQRASAS